MAAFMPPTRYQLGICWMYNNICLTQCHQVQDYLWWSWKPCLIRCNSQWHCQKPPLEKKIIAQCWRLYNIASLSATPDKKTFFNNKVTSCLQRLVCFLCLYSWVWGAEPRMTAVILTANITEAAGSQTGTGRELGEREGLSGWSWFIVHAR